MDAPGKMKQDVLDLQNGYLKLFKARATSHGVKVRFPSDMADARAILLSGEHSILKNFPTPRVYDIDDDHVGVSLLETILIAAGHGTKFNFLWDAKKKGRNTEGLNGTQAATDLLAETVQTMWADGQNRETIRNTNIGWIYFWSDSFLNCYVKQKDNSVWVLTVTICPPESEKTAGKNTFVLAIGRSGADVDHRKVIKHYLEEYQRLVKGFDVYFGETNEIGRMAVNMLFWSADRPERQMIGSTMKEGIYGKVSGWAVNISEDKFPSCLRCYRARFRQMIGLGDADGDSCKCDKCLDWTLDPDKEEQKTDKPSPKYPKGNVEEEARREDAVEGRLPGQDWLGPIKLSTEWLRKAVRRAYNGRRNDGWTQDELGAYLQSCNVSHTAVTVKLDKLAVGDKDQDKVSDPSAYEPETWSLVDLFRRFRLPDLPMHGLAHGIIGDVMDIISTILTSYGKKSEFYGFGNKNVMEDVASLRLSWCKTKSLPKTAWVNENSMAYMRLMSYLYGMYFSNYSLSGREVSEKAKETVRNVKCMVNALQALMSVLMSKDKPDKSTIEAVDNHMKLFMSSADYLHRRHGSLAKKPKDKGGVIDQLSREELEHILVSAFDEDPRPLEDANKTELQKKVAKIVTPTLVAKCKELGLDAKGLKPALQKRLLEHLTQRRLETAGQAVAENGAAPPREKGEKMCWGKGAWTSFTVNIADQIAYLGTLGLIW